MAKGNSRLVYFSGDKLLRGETNIPFRVTNGRVEFTIPKVRTTK
jgi:hypothetical protein